MMHLIRLSALRLALRETVVRKDGSVLSLDGNFPDMSVL